MDNYDAWLNSAAEQIYERMLVEQTTDDIVAHIYADQKLTERKLKDFDFLLTQPDRVSWVHKAFEYATDNDISVYISCFDDIFEILRNVRAHRKAKRKTKAVGNKRGVET